MSAFETNLDRLETLLGRVATEVAHVSRQLAEIDQRVRWVEDNQEASFNQRIHLLAGMSTPSLHSIPGHASLYSRPGSPEPAVPVNGRLSSTNPFLDEQVPIPPQTGRYDEVRPNSPPALRGIIDLACPPPQSGNNQPAATWDPAESTRREIDDLTFRLNNLRRELEATPPQPNVRPQPQQPERITVSSSPNSIVPTPLMEYDGTWPWEQFQLHFDMVTLANGWSSHTACVQLLTRLRGRALQLILTGDEREKRDLGTLTRVLAARFGTNRTENSARSELRRRTQRPGETLESFARELEYLTRLVYPNWPPNYWERLAFDQFLDGIADPEVQLAVRNGCPRDVREACEIGARFTQNRAATRATQRTFRAAAAQVLTETQSPPSQSKSQLQSPKPSGNETGSI